MRGNLRNISSTIRSGYARRCRRQWPLGGATLIDLCVHQFSPHGITATATLAESHIALHTWPEFGYFAADLFFCGKGDPHRAMRSLQEALQAKQVRYTELKRGFEYAPSVREVVRGSV